MTARRNNSVGYCCKDYCFGIQRISFSTDYKLPIHQSITCFAWLIRNCITSGKFHHNFNQICCRKQRTINILWIIKMIFNSFLTFLFQNLFTSIFFHGNKVCECLLNLESFQFLLTQVFLFKKFFQKMVIQAGWCYRFASFSLFLNWIVIALNCYQILSKR